ncbi:hypothetical protein [Pararhodobacter marinus]|uniref:hypothetical protein n=1 Tax=Pararhodobacter marinus TaxID=2184063 RepID=UPI003516AA3A
MRISPLNLLIAERRDAFCRIHRLGFSTLRAACGGQAAEATGALRRILTALDEGLSDTAPDAPLPAPRLHPDAVAYLVLGSQMGTEMMRRGLPEDQQTGYFGQEPDMAAWRAFCKRMGGIDSTTPEAARILSDANRAFAIFAAAADRILMLDAQETLLAQAG